MAFNSFVQERPDSTFFYYNSVTLLTERFCHGNLINLWQGAYKEAYACWFMHLKKIAMEGVGTTSAG